MGDVAKAVRAVLASNIDASEYDHHDKAMPVELIENPYAFYDKVRAELGPVPRLERGVLEGVDYAKYMRFDPSDEIYMAMSYEASSTILREGTKIFGQAMNNSFRLAWGDTPVSLDPPEHQPVRALVTNAIDRMQIDHLDANVIRPAARLLAEEIRTAGGGNLVTQFTGLIPFLVTADLLGLDPADFQWIMKRVKAMMALGVDFDAGIAAAMEMYEYLTAIYEDRLRQPREDLISDLIAVEIDGQRLNRDQVLSFCRIVLPAGIETTTKQFGNLMVALLTMPDQMDLVRNSRSNIEAAVHEATRWEAPIMMGPKKAREATVLDGVSIPEGAFLLENHGYANHDPSRWPDPHRFDLGRPRITNVAFGAGPHFCPGSRLARKEMEVGLEILLETMPALRLDDDYPVPKIRGFSVRTTPEIHVLA